MILNTKRIHNSFWGNFPARAKKFNALKSFICQQEKATTGAVRSLWPKIVIVGNSKWVKNHISALNYLTVLVYTKTIIYLSVRGWWWILSLIH